MPSTYSNLGVQLIGTGEQAGTWGDSTNVNWTLIDSSVNGVANISVSTTSVNVDVTNILLTPSDGQNRVLIFTDSPTQTSTVNIRITKNSSTGSPYFEGWYFIKNNLVSQSILIYQDTLSPPSGAQVTIPNGKDAIVYFDGSGNTYQYFINPAFTTIAASGNATVGGDLAVTGNAAINRAAVAGVGLVCASDNDTTSTFSFRAYNSSGSTAFQIYGDKQAYFYGNVTISSANISVTGSGTFLGNVGANRSAVSTVGCATASTTTTSASYSLYCYDSAGTSIFYVRGDGGLVCNGAKTESPAGTGATTASSANMYIAASGGNSQILRSTSSIRYKNSIENATYGLFEVMQLRPVTYKGNNDGDKIFGGLIAEEVDTINKLQPFVVYNEDGQPDALAYGNMVSLLTKAIQEQQVMIEDLKARVAALGG